MKIFNLYLLITIIITGCALPVTRSLDSTTGKHEENIWGDDVSRTSVTESKNHLLEARIGMTAQEVKNIMGLPDKIQKTSNEEIWIYYLEGTRWIIPPFLPIGRNNYKFIFNNNILKKIYLETMEYL